MRDVVLRLPASPLEYEDAIKEALTNGDYDGIWGATKDRLEELHAAFCLL